MIDATSFADVEEALVAALQLTPGGSGPNGAMISNTTPTKPPAKLVTVSYSGGGSRDWGEAAANAGVNVTATTDSDCRDLVKAVQDRLAVTSNDLIEAVQVPAGGGIVIPGQTPPYRRYFAVTVMLRGQTVL